MGKIQKIWTDWKAGEIRGRRYNSIVLQYAREAMHVLQSFLKFHDGFVSRVEQQYN